MTAMSDPEATPMHAMTTGQRAALALRQWADYRAGTPGTCFAAPDFSIGLDDAYAVQDAVAALRVAAGDRVAGYKLGCTGPGTTTQFGMAGPIRARLFDSEILPNGAVVEGGRFDNLAIEGEMALRIGADGAIEAAFPVIELHHFVFRGQVKTLSELVANNGLNGGIVLPDISWQRLCVGVSGPMPVLSVRIDGQEVGAGAPWPLGGGARASLDWLRAHLAGFGLAPQPGQIILAGTVLALYPTAPGARVDICIDGAPVTRCTVL